MFGWHWTFEHPGSNKASESEIKTPWVKTPFSFCSDDYLRRNDGWGGITCDFILHRMVGLRFSICRCYHPNVGRQIQQKLPKFKLDFIFFVMKGTLYKLEFVWRCWWFMIWITFELTMILEEENLGRTVDLKIEFDDLWIALLLFSIIFFGQKNYHLVFLPILIRANLLAYVNYRPTLSIRHSTAPL